MQEKDFISYEYKNGFGQGERPDKSNGYVRSLRLEITGTASAGNGGYNALFEAQQESAA